MAHLIFETLSPLFVVFAAFLALTTLRRLYFHKLKKFPGPRLAASSSLYKTYYEVVKGGELLQHLVGLHAQYGPVVRIAPNELHFNSYLAYADIYRAGSTFTKHGPFYKCFGADGSAFGAIDPQDSKRRRGVLNPFFSRRAILNLEGVVQEKVDKLINCLTQRQQGKPVNMFLAFRCATMDIITSYSFAHCTNSLDAADFYDPLLVTIQTTIPLIWVIKMLPFLVPCFSMIPEWFAKRLSPQLLAFSNLRKLIGVQIDKVLSGENLLESADNLTIYHRLLKVPSGDDQPSLPTRRNLIEEALSLLQAGSDTVGNTCTIGTFYALNDRTVRMKLFHELRDAWPDKNIPIGYCTAVIKESLRLSHGIVTPLPRVVGPIDTVIAGYAVPANAVVGVSATCIHNDIEIFPEPQTFSPERWLQPYSRELDIHLVPFSRGPRMCLGINLAWCELYLIFGNIFRKLEMNIHDTSIEDLRRFKEFFIPVHQGRQFHVVLKEESS
ncbi:cytochrome P450 [Collybia nuda]|uniref:Cytochrome P450 n=1 Tax=Collybia nuda TaxID=64659 RepID=A0A9P5YK30_9AGAR|nr:cytochrome P450 [Collybia nuda]